MNRSTTSWLFLLVATSYFLVLAAPAQSFTSSKELHNSIDLTASVESTRPAVSDGYIQPIPIGFYNPDGRFRPARGTSAPDALDRDEFVPNQSEVPISLGLHSDEGVVENIAPPGRAYQRPKGHSLLAILRDNLITVAYGHAKVLQNPTHVTTDSQGRLIVSDPQSSAVHVLDPAGKKSFRISGGPTHRLQVPGSIAVDAKDNIYVADLKLNLISVYGSEGRFLRYIGTISGESMFEAPGAIAIDRKTAKLYVLDTPADELVVLDLQGKVLRRVGNQHTRGNVRLKHPTEIALWKDQVYVLDGFGSRVQILDSELQQVDSFDVRDANEAPVSREMGMALDQHGNIYLSNLLLSSVRVYSPNGQFVASVGRQGPTQKYGLPLGIWVDSGDRLFICDSTRGRVQIFQIGSMDGAIAAVRE